MKIDLTEKEWNWILMHLEYYNHEFDKAIANKIKKAGLRKE